VNGRGFQSDLKPELLSTVQAGVFRTVYRGVPFLKSPFDIALYLQLLSRLRPLTVIEIGCKHGGSALWFADMITVQQSTPPRIIAVDIAPAAKLADPRITFLEGEAAALEQCLPPALLEACPRPWLVVEDSSHRYEDSLAVLQFFHSRLRSDDYIVVEDGVVDHFAEPRYAAYDNGPNRAVADFLAIHAEDYEIDLGLCDRYGLNVTYNPNGWLRRL
jgi:cephalosporin hydroxylase